MLLLFAKESSTDVIDKLPSHGPLGGVRVPLPPTKMFPGALGIVSGALINKG